jgi:hypothetical protein
MKKSVWLLALALLPISSIAGEVGTVRDDTKLMAAPYRDAKVASDIANKTHVDIVERRGAWVHVTTTDKKDGWLRLTQVRLGDGPEKQGSNGLAELWSVSKTGRSGTQGIVATTGVRGMSAEQLKQSEPNLEQYEKLDGYRAEEQPARDYAGAAGLKEKKVAALKSKEGGANHEKN